MSPSHVQEESLFARGFSIATAIVTEVVVLSIPLVLVFALSIVAPQNAAHGGVRQHEYGRFLWESHGCAMRRRKKMMKNESGVLETQFRK